MYTGLSLSIFELAINTAMGIILPNMFLVEFRTPVLSRARLTCIRFRLKSIQSQDSPQSLANLIPVCMATT